MRGRTSWGSVALVVVLVAAIALWFTGRLELHWRPATKMAAKDDGHGHEGARKRRRHAEEEGRVQGDKAVLDADAVKAAGLRSEPVRSGSVAVALDAVGEIQVPDERVAHVTPRVSGVVREISKARGDAVAAGASLGRHRIGRARRGAGGIRRRRCRIWRWPRANVEAWRRRRPQTGLGAAALVAGSSWTRRSRSRPRPTRNATSPSAAFNRLKELQERGLRSRTELLAAEADVAKARARAEAAERRIRVLGTVADTELARARQRARGRESEAAGLSEARRAAGGASGVTRVVIRSPIAGVVSATRPHPGPDRGADREDFFRWPTSARSG